MKFLCVLSVLCGLIVPSFALDREAFTFTNYDLELRVEPEQQRLGVRGKITLRNDSATPQKNVALQISSSLNWSSIQLSGKPVQFVTHEYTSDVDHTGALSEAIVNLPQEVSPKGTVELEIGYEGVIALDTTRLTQIGVPDDKAKHSDWDQIGKSFTAVRGIGYVTWYPIATEAASLSDGNSVFETVGRWKAREAESSWSVNLCAVSSTVQAEIMNDVAEGDAAENGHHEVKTINGTSCAEHVYRPLRQAVPAFLSGNYAELENSAIRINYLPEHKAGAESYGLAAELAVPLVKEWFGAPRNKAEAAELTDADAAPFESGNLLLIPLAGDDSRLYQLTAVHQLTHAAFFSPRPWIYEGLAHFAQALEREQQSGRQAALDFMGLHRGAIADAEKAIAAQHDLHTAAQESLINTSTEEFYRSKAMYVWWMLRDMVGEAGLKKALAAYRADQDKEPAYVQHLIEAQTKRDLEWFFDDWVYRDRSLPDFHVESVYPRQTVNGEYVVTVTVENLGDAGAEVPVMLRMEGSELRNRLEVRAKSKAVLRFEADSTPQEVIVNDGSVPESDMSNNTYKIEALKH